MSYQDNKISQLIEDQLPNFLQEEGPKFVQFVEKYYEWMETSKLEVSVSTGGTISLSSGAKIKATKQINGSDDVKHVYAEVINSYLLDNGNYLFYIKEYNEDPNSPQTRGFSSGEAITIIEGDGGSSGTINVVSYIQNVTLSSKNLWNLQDIDRTLDDYVDYFMKEYLEGFPLAFPNELQSADIDVPEFKKFLVKHSREFYQSKGTVDSFKYFFRSFFNDSVEVTYPKDEILKPSDNTFSRTKTIFLQPNSLTPPDIESQKIKGQTSGVSAYIETIIGTRKGEYDVFQIELNETGLSGDFLQGENIVLESNPSTIIGTVHYGTSEVEIYDVDESFTEEGVYYIDRGGEVVEFSNIPNIDRGALTQISTCEINSGKITGINMVNDPSSTNTITQLGSNLEPSDGQDTDLFSSGLSLSDDGTVMAVGAMNWDGPGQSYSTNQGAVYIYDWTDTDNDNTPDSWVQRGSVITADTGFNNRVNSGRFGESTSLNSDGTILAVGAQKGFGDTALQGVVYVYEYVNGSWTPRGSKVEHSNPSGDLHTTVSLSGDGLILVVGTYLWEGDISNQGTVFVYDWDSDTEQWIERQNVISNDAAQDDFFGRGVSINKDGNILAVGAPNWEGSLENQGGVYIYDYNNISKKWIQRGEVLESYSPIVDGSFGFSLKLSNNGNSITVSHYQLNAASGNKGRIEIYDYKSSSKEWVLRKTLDNPESVSSNSYSFGYDLGVSESGNFFVVAERGDGVPDAQNPFTGRVRTYSITVKPYKTGDKLTFDNTDCFSETDPTRPIEAFVLYADGGGNIKDIRVTTTGKGYIKLPTITTIGSTDVSGETLNIISQDVGTIKRIKIRESGIKYVRTKVEGYDEDWTGSGIYASRVLKKTEIGIELPYLTLDITNPSGNFTVGEIVSHQSLDGTGKVVSWNSGTNKLVLREYSGVFSSSGTDTIQGSTSNETGTVSVASYAQTKYKIGNGQSIWTSLSYSSGIWSDSILNQPYSINLDLNSSGTDNIKLKLGSIFDDGGRFLNNNSFVSDVKYIQDSFFYQVYSYVLKTSLEVDKYKDLLKRLIHPAGMEMFGKIESVSSKQVKMSVSDIKSNISMHFWDYIKKHADTVIRDFDFLYSLLILDGSSSSNSLVIEKVVDGGDNSSKQFNLINGINYPIIPEVQFHGSYACDFLTNKDTHQNNRFKIKYKNLRPGTLDNNDFYKWSQVTGTVSIPIDSHTVTGYGTTFTSLSSGDVIAINGQQFTISSITNDTTLVVNNCSQLAVTQGENIQMIKRVLISV